MVRANPSGRARPEIATEALGPASDRRADWSQAITRLIWVPFDLVDQGRDQAGPIHNAPFGYWRWWLRIKRRGGPRHQCAELPRARLNIDIRLDRRLSIPHGDLIVCNA